MAHMNSASYDKLRCASRGKFSIQQFLRLKELAANTVGVNNSIFDIELNSLLTLYNSLCKEIKTLEAEITKLIEEVHPHYMSIPGIGPISAAVIYAEYGDISNFSNPGQMLAFAGIEPGINDSGTESHGGRHNLCNLLCKETCRRQKTQGSYYSCSKETDQSHLCIGEAGCRL